jgi:beta-galactosidase
MAKIPETQEEGSRKVAKTRRGSELAEPRCGFILSGMKRGTFLAAMCLLLSVVKSAAAYEAPASPRAVYSLDIGWKFIRRDVAGAQAIEFDDSAWETVSTPHTYNDIDTFNRIISHSGGQQGAYMGPAWYRKHFKLPADLQDRKLYIEFEGMRQAGQIFLNGNEIGLYENGVTAYGLDITGSASFGDKENILAVRVDNRTNYAEKATGTVFQWEAKDFNPDYGGINRHVRLIVTAKIHQTLPLYYGLETTGVYVYPSGISVGDHTADVNVESQVANESGDQASVTLSVIVVDAAGKVVAKFDGDTVDLVDGEKTVAHASGRLAGARFWSPDDPYLYDVYTVLTVDGKMVDVARTHTGFRKVEFRSGAGTGGVYINDKFTYLTGYAQRSTNEWTGLGQAYPDWMHDITAKLIHDSHANYLRWMHISPQRVDVDTFDRVGIVEVCPAGDKEKDPQGRQWEQRLEVMRDSMIYYRNSPSILFWEAGNNGITAEQMKQMVDLKAQWDPNGERAMGCRTLNDPAATPIAEYFGVMIGQDPRTDALRSPDELFRAYSAQRRDRAPLIETEDFRDEAARRFWDDSSPPHFGFKPGPNDTYHWNSETFCLAAAGRYWAYWSNRISNLDPRHSKWSGYASIYFSDSNADGRQDSSEVCRVSGKVDAVRLPKEAWYAYRVMQNPQADIHIIGHWTYPAGTKKTMYVFCNCDTVELSVNGILLGKVDHPSNGYVFAFPGVAWAPGAIKAVGYKQGKAVCDDELTTAGPAAAVKLRPIVGPGGLKADDADVALFDVEVVDSAGRRCPTDEGRIDFAVSGPGIWRGGYNSGIVGSTNNLYLNTECGINRVSVRSTLTPGTITLTATRPGLRPAQAQVISAPIAATDGLSVEWPQ